MPSSAWGRGVAKLRFAALYQTLASPTSGEAELPDPRPQAELGNERSGAKGDFNKAWRRHTVPSLNPAAIIGLAVVGGIILGIAGVIVGALFGGSFATDFQLGDARGYEAAGQPGGLLGLVLGVVLSVVIGRQTLLLKSRT